MAADAGAARRPTALITGASGGIGAALAREFAAHGYDLVLVARRQDRLVTIARALAGAYGIAARVIEADLARPQAPDEIYQQVEAQGVAVEVLVNNAGFGTYGPFAETDLRAELEMLQVNVVALTHLTKLFLRDMLARGHGKVLNVASTAAFQPGPLAAVYYATKAYVLSLSEALANEVQGTGVTVTALCPGPTATGFQRRARMEDTRLMRSPLVMDAAAVARVGYRALMAGETVAIPGWTNRALTAAVRLMPRRLVTRIVRQVSERTHAR
ncbi:MAG TPA: SDR family oxidoreductase [Chloroflexota bacterium]|nr:SDR family oxidoreductase [Chloroflexota bacterium]